MRTKVFFLIILVLTKLNLHGQYAGGLDNTFGINGKVVTPAFPFDECDWEGHCMAIQTDGKIIVGGNKCGYGDIIRYNPDGIIDSSFGTDGVASTKFAQAKDIAIQQDGKICVTDQGSNGTDLDFAVERFKPNGSVDSSFGNNGSVVTFISHYDENPYSIVIQSDGKILISGSSYISTVVIRYNADGSLDSSFGAGGIVFLTLSPTYWSNLNKLAIQSDGKIVAVGYYSLSNNDAAVIVIRFNTDGVFDTTFGNGGKVYTHVGNAYLDFAADVKIQQDNKIIVAVQSNDTNSENFAAVRYNTDGSLDTTFGIGGKVITVISGGDNVSSVAIQGDGKILLAGTSTVTSFANANFALACYNMDGSLNSSFGNSGIVITDFGSNFDYADAMALQSDNKIVLAGYTNPYQWEALALARYNSSLNVGIIEGTSAQHQMLIFPNPLTSSSTLQLNTQVTNAEVIIYDMVGKELWRKKLIGDKMEIERGSLESGVYFVKIVSEERQWVEKMVVE